MKHNINQLQGYINQYESAFKRQNISLMQNLMQKINSLNVSICAIGEYIEFYHSDSIYPVYKFTKY